jgi:hypothetical protein
MPEQLDADDDRDETPTERLDRNWNELLQELRVIQTGVQLLTGFLLTLPFQQRFTELSAGERGVYYTTVVASVLATILLQTPVIVHRALFRRHRRAETVLVAHRLAVAGVAVLAVGITGVSCLITSALWGLGPGSIAAAVVVALLLIMWVAVPTFVRFRHSSGVG